jgi:hypothetical protein
MKIDDIIVSITLRYGHFWIPNIRHALKIGARQISVGRRSDEKNMRGNYRFNAVELTPRALAAMFSGYIK